MQSIKAVKASIELPQKLISCLPLPLCDAIRRTAIGYVEEIRIHRDRICTVTSNGQSYSTGQCVTESEINDILHHMCGGSLYAYQNTINQGYLALGDGIRVGVCGSAALENGRIIGISDVSGLIVRIPHRHTLDVDRILTELDAPGSGGLLLYSPPGVGKTTVLRNVALAASSGTRARHTVVVDTREELGYSLEGEALSLDVLLGYPKKTGIEIAVRTLGAQLVVCDEIGDAEDAKAILSASNCGVPLVASAHAASATELLARPPIRLLHNFGVFRAYVGLKRDPYGQMTYRITTRDAACRSLATGILP